MQLAAGNFYLQLLKELICMTFRKMLWRIPVTRVKKRSYVVNKYLLLYNTVIPSAPYCRGERSDWGKEIVSCLRSGKLFGRSWTRRVIGSITIRQQDAWGVDWSAKFSYNIQATSLTSVTVVTSVLVSSTSHNFASSVSAFLWGY
jgi:hypothetical protein